MKKLITACLFALISFAASANEIPFTEALYQQYQKSNENYLIHVAATWCPVCKKQKGILNQYFSEHPDSKVKVLNVDYDDQKQWVTHFKAPRQSTFILYHGAEQRWFSVSETSKAKIFSILQNAEKS